MTINALLLRLTRDRPARAIDRRNGSPYLERYYLARLRWPECTAYLHRWRDGDGDEHVHDHPWGWSVAIVLTGGYTEEVLTGFDPGGWHHRIRRARRWWPRILTARTFHRIATIQPRTWTLFVHGPRRKSWGFLSAMRTWDPRTRAAKVHGLIYTRSRDALDGEQSWPWWDTAPPGALLRRSRGETA